ncbi:MAG: fucose isomerase, partial [Sciscionella sp.]
MARIGLISISDGREFVHRDLEGFIGAAQDRLAAALRSAGHEVVVARAAVNSNAAAVSVAREVDAARPDLTVLHYAVWA